MAALAERPRLVVDRPRGFGRASAAAAPDRLGGGRLTLQQRLDSVWEGLHADGAAECPVCHGRMAAGEPVSCSDCGARLW